MSFLIGELVLFAEVDSRLLTVSWLEWELQVRVQRLLLAAEALGKLAERGFDYVCLRCSTSSTILFLHLGLD